MYTCVCIHMSMYTHVWGYSSRSYAPSPRVKIAKIKGMATWLEPGARPKSHTAQHPPNSPRFLSHPPSDTQSRQTLQSRHTHTHKKIGGHFLLVNYSCTLGHVLKLLIYPVFLHWGKLIFPFPAGISVSSVINHSSLVASFSFTQSFIHSFFKENITMK